VRRTALPPHPEPTKCLLFGFGACFASSNRTLGKQGRPRHPRAEPLLRKRERCPAWGPAFVTLPAGRAHCATQRCSKQPGVPPCSSSLAPGPDRARMRGLAGSEGHLPDTPGSSACSHRVPSAPLPCIQQHLPAGSGQRDPPRAGEEHLATSW